MTYWIKSNKNLVIHFSWKKIHVVWNVIEFFYIADFQMKGEIKILPKKIFLFPEGDVYMHKRQKI